MEIEDSKLSIGGINAEELVRKFGSPLYVYDEKTIRARISELKEAFPYEMMRILYACKANSNLHILRLIHSEGFGVDAVSPGEVLLALKAGFRPKDIIYTANNITDEEMRFAKKKGVLLNLDSISAIQRYGKMNPRGKICIRFCPQVRAGFNDKVQTGHQDSKFGLLFSEAGEAKKIAQKHRLRIIGLHEHSGSGITDIKPFLEAMRNLLDIAVMFPDLEFIDFGGGFPVQYSRDDKRFDIATLGREMSKTFSRFCGCYGRPLSMCVEPGRFVISDAGFALTKVNTIKRRATRTFIGTDLGFSQFIRPALYGAAHRAINASSAGGKEEDATIVGNICESSDVLSSTKIGRVSEGDIIALLDAGAYCFSMASNYNSRPLPAEVMVSDGKARIIRKRQQYDSLFCDFHQKDI